MASLTGTKVSDTYQQLLKLTSQGVGADASGKYVEDGLGTDTALSLSTTRVGIGTTSVSSDAALGVSGNIELKNAGDKYWIPRQSDGALTGSIYSRTGSNVTISGAGSSSGLIELIPSSSNSSSVAVTIKANGEVQFGDSNNTADLYHYGEGKFAINDSAGSASTPTYAFNSDTDTGMYRGGANDLRFATGGTQRMQIESDGTIVMAGALQPAGNLSVGGYAKTSNYFETAGGSGGQQAFSSSVTSSYRGGGLIRFFTDNNVSIFKFGDEGAPYGGYFGTFGGYTPSGAELMVLGIDGVNLGTNRGSEIIGLRVANDGDVGIGTTSPAFGNGDGLEIERAGTATLRLENTSTTKGYEIYLTDDLVIDAMNSSSDIVLLPESNVGIGAEPAKLLHISGHDATMRITDTTGQNWSWDISVGVTADARFAIKDASGNTEVFYINGNSNDAYFKSSANSVRAMEIAQNWNGSGDASTCLDLSIGNTNKASYLLRGYNGGSQIFLVAGNNGAVTTTAGTYGTISDSRLKENITDANNKLNDLLSLNVKNFNFIGSEEKYIGFIAQEFEEVFPNLVTTKDTREYDEDDNVVSGYEDTKGLKVGMEFAILVKAIQELSAQNDALKARLDDLEPEEAEQEQSPTVKERVNSLEARVNDLENG